MQQHYRHIIRYDFHKGFNVTDTALEDVQFMGQMLLNNV